MIRAIIRMTVLVLLTCSVCTFLVSCGDGMSLRPGSSGFAMNGRYNVSITSVPEDSADATSKIWFVRCGAMKRCDHQEAATIYNIVKQSGRKMLLENVSGSDAQRAQTHLEKAGIGVEIVKVSP